MKRDANRILAFKRLTQVGKAPEHVLEKRVKKKINEIARKIYDKQTSKFDRAYLYVAMATCLEVDLKYKFRFTIESVGPDFDLFQSLYGEGKLDLGLIFHVVNESITLPDLIAEATSASDAVALISRLETLLGALTGKRCSLRQSFLSIANSTADEGEKTILLIATNNYDKIIKDIELIFQIRHAIVHDIFIAGGPVERAIKKLKLSDVFDSCLSFLLLAEKAYFEAFMKGKFRPEILNPRTEARQGELLKIAGITRNRLANRHPAARKPLMAFDDAFDQIISIVTDTIEAIRGGSFGEDEKILSPYLVNTFFGFAAKIAHALEMESQETRAESGRRRKARSRPSAPDRIKHKK